MIKQGVTRRTAFTLLAAAAAMPSVAMARTPQYTWQGQALGGQSKITIVHPNPRRAAAMAHLVRDEIERLENIFSLYRENSELARLNADGELPTPSHDLKQVLKKAAQMHALSKGAFDITVQPLWQAVAAGADPATVLSAVDGSRVIIDTAGVRFARPAMAATLNGIAQGYIADRVATLLRQQGLLHALLNVGEVVAIGAAESDTPWRVALDHGESDNLVVRLRNRALATSRNAGPHIINPKTGEVSGGFEAVTVMAQSAMVADALSTAAFHMRETAMPGLLRAAGANRAWIHRKDGTTAGIEPI